MRFERSQCHAIGRTAAGIIAAVLLGATMTSCTGWPGPYGSGRHLKDNPFDKAIWSGDESKAAKEARQRLLKRFPIGSQTADLRLYLESIGGSCGSGAGGPLVCQYSHYMLLGNRGIIGDEWRSYRHFDFTTRVWPGKGPVAKLTVCHSITREVERGPMILSSRHKPRESKFKPCGDRSGKQRAIGGDSDAR